MRRIVQIPEPDGKLPPGADPELAINIRQMSLNGPDADELRCGDLLVREPLHDGCGDLCFRRRQNSLGVNGFRRREAASDALLKRLVLDLLGDEQGLLKSLIGTMSGASASKYTTELQEGSGLFDAKFSARQ